MIGFKQILKLRILKREQFFEKYLRITLQKLPRNSNQ